MPKEKKTVKSGRIIRKDSSKIGKEIIKHYKDSSKQAPDPTQSTGPRKEDQGEK